MTQQLTITPIEAINEYYRLKDKYERSYYEKYVKPIVSSKQSKREKRVEYSKLPKPDCINCKRQVGSIFSITNNTNENVRTYKAKCGDIQDPCPLDIDIKYSNRDKFNTLINETLTNIDKIKLDIIKEKNNAIFFNKSVVSIFDKLTEELKTEADNSGFLIETNILKNDNPEKHQLLKLSIDEFGKGFILPFKQMINEYLEKNDELKLSSAIDFYVNEMIPKLEEIKNLKYDVNFVEYDDNSKTYKLHQYANSLENQEFYLKGDDKVETFVIGVKKDKRKTKKTLPITDKNKTKKIRPAPELIVMEDDDEEAEFKDEQPTIEDKTELNNKYGDDYNIKPTITANGEVIWNNTEYQQLWTKMPHKLKYLLKMDPEWLEEYMNECVKSRDSNKPCTLFIPKSATLPPKLLDNGEYDFNSSVLNKIFNRLDKTQQDTLLTLYNPNNPDMFKNALSKIIETFIGYDYRKGYF